VIPYVRAINYLSPSSFMQLEQRPVEFYLRRLGPQSLAPPPEQQSFPAAVGIVFDALVKRALADRCGIKCPSLAYLLREVTAERERALELGRVLLAGYESSGAMAALMDEGPGMLDIALEDFVPGTEVPMRVKLDALTSYPVTGTVTVHDWKVAGANRPGSRSPTPGYLRLWDTDSANSRKGPHPRHVEPLEALNEDWATQVAIYGWIVGKPIGDTVASIDEILVGENGRVRTAQFRATVTAGFQVALRERIVEAWRKIREERVVPPEFAEHGAELLGVLF